MVKLNRRHRKTNKQYNKHTETQKTKIQQKIHFTEIYLTLKTIQIERHRMHSPSGYVKHTDVNICQQFKGEETWFESASTLEEEIASGAICLLPVIITPQTSQQICLCQQIT